MTRREAAEMAVLQVVCTHGWRSIIASSLGSEVNWLLAWDPIYHLGIDPPNTLTKQAYVSILKENHVE